MTHPEAFDMAARMGVVVRRGIRSHERAISDQIREAHARVQWARSIATRTVDSDVRVHYLEMWLASLCTIARALP